MVNAAAPNIKIKVVTICSPIIYFEKKALGVQRANLLTKDEARQLSIGLKPTTLLIRSVARNRRRGD